MPLQQYKAVLLVLLPFLASAHPGIGIVADSRGNIYYSDLEQVFKITNGRKTVAVPNVHTHELYLDAHDNLYGENLTYAGEASNKFYHYLWRLHPNGRLETVLPTRQAYVQIDYSLARDRQGNEYYIRQFIRNPDTAHIYKKTPDGKETVFASGNFRGVEWLHPQQDGSLLFEWNNNIYRAEGTGRTKLVATHIAGNRPSYTYYGNRPLVWGLWQDRAGNVYAAVYSDQVIKKITPDGVVSVYYTSSGRWTPGQGVFDNKGQLWVLETSDKNETRVITVPAQTRPATKTSFSFYSLLIPLALLIMITVLLVRRKGITI